MKLEKYDEKELVFVSMDDEVEDFLIGYIQCLDKEGLILLNIDYRGIAAGYIYLSASKITGMETQNPYLTKIKYLMDSSSIEATAAAYGPIRKLQDSKTTFFKFAETLGEKAHFCAYCNDEAIEGCLQANLEDAIEIAFGDASFPHALGYSILRKDVIDCAVIKL